MRPPADEKTRQDLLFGFLSTGVDLDKLPRYYAPYRRVAPQLLRSTEAVNRSGKVAVGNIPLRKVPVVSRYSNAWMLVDGRNGEPVRVVSD